MFKIGQFKHESDNLKESLEIMCNNRIAASISVWYEKTTSQVRLLEKEVAALRIGATLGKRYLLSLKWLFLIYLFLFDCIILFFIIKLKTYTKFYVIF